MERSSEGDINFLLDRNTEHAFQCNRLICLLLWLVKRQAVSYFCLLANGDHYGFCKWI